MPAMLADYQEIVGEGVIDELRVVADRVRGRSMQHINSTAVGGGVAEILTRLVPLMNELGVQASWDVIKGDQAFFNVTKAFHNALHGKQEEITDNMLDIFRATTEANLRDVNITGDVVLIHDPQPAGLIRKKQDVGRQWVWRCHIDVSTPQADVWNFLRPYVDQYGAAIFSMPDFAQQLSVPQFRIAPSIDPLSDKNREDCQLVLAGGGAPDDPEGEAVLSEVREAAANDPDIHVLLLPPFSDLEINALVRGSTVVLQKSIREGFGLTVSEALWKRKPVIGGAVGGIKLQIIDGITGFLVHSPEGAATRIAELLRDRRLRDRIGENGYQHVKQNFLVTRHVKDYILIMLALDHPGESVVQLN